MGVSGRENLKVRDGSGADIRSSDFVVCGF
jgi:hypothetical protein